MKQFKLFWVSGNHITILGTDIVNAFISAGYQTYHLLTLENWEEVKNE